MPIRTKEETLTLIEKILTDIQLAAAGDGEDPDLRQTAETIFDLVKDSDVA